MQNRLKPGTLPAANGHSALPAPLTAGPGLHVQLPADALRPMIEQVVEATIARLEEVRASLPAKLCYSEPEAAALLGLEPHQLRDERLRGRIGASAIVGRRIRYLHGDLVGYLMSRRQGAEDDGEPARRATRRRK